MTENTSYTQKEIEIQIEVNRGISASNNIIKINSTAMEVEICQHGLPDKTRATIQLYGLSMSLIEQLCSLNSEANYVSNHRVSIYAGSSLDSLSVVFIGEITKVFANFNTMPDICLEIQAMTGFYPSLIPAFPLSYKGEIPASIILSTLALSMGYNFENKGFTGSLRNPILSGSPFEKALKVAKQTNAELICDSCSFTLMPKNTALSSMYTSLSDKNGLIGYPVFDNDGLSFTALYNKNFKLNALVKISSIVPKSSGYWRIISIKHVLSCHKVDSISWFSFIHTLAYN